MQLNPGSCYLQCRDLVPAFDLTKHVQIITYWTVALSVTPDTCAVLTGKNCRLLPKHNLQIQDYQVAGYCWDVG